MINTLFLTLSFLTAFANATPCADGWESPSTGSGTCSHHGGIAENLSSYVSPCEAWKTSGITEKYLECLKTERALLVQKLEWLKAHPPVFETYDLTQRTREIMESNFGSLSGSADSKMRETSQWILSLSDDEARNLFKLYKLDLAIKSLGRENGFMGLINLNNSHSALTFMSEGVCVVFSENPHQLIFQSPYGPTLFVSADGTKELVETDEAKNIYQFEKHTTSKGEYCFTKKDFPQ